MGWQSGGVGKSQCTDFGVEVEIVILDVGLTLKDEITLEELGYLMVSRTVARGRSHLLHRARVDIGEDVCL